MTAFLMRFRALAVLLATVALLVALPGTRNATTSRSADGSVITDGSSASGVAPDGTLLADGPGAGVVDGGSAGPGGTGTGVTAGAGRSGGQGGGGPAASAPKAGADGSVIVNGVAFPGIGSEHAKANRTCDPATGRTRWPSTQGPRCVPKWPAGADNLGATATGVTKDKITIVAPFVRSSTQSDDDIRTIKQMVRESFFMTFQHVETYGRRIDLKFFEATGTDEVAQRADAVEIFNKHKPFMVVDYVTGLSIFGVRNAELAGRGVLVVLQQPPWKQTQSLAPYIWGVGMDERLFVEHIAEFVGKGLKGRPARWAGNAAMTSQPRSFGLIYPSDWDIGFFNAAAGKHGLQVADKVAYNPGNPTAYQDQVRVHMAKLSNAKVNNVIAAAELFYMVFATKEATAQGYFPEWTITGWGVSDVTLAGRLYDPGQQRQMFGIGNVPVLYTNSADQGGQRYYRWEFGRAPANAATAGQIYLIIAIAARGIQDAGPNLTAKSFQRAMFDQDPTGGAWCDCVASGGDSFGRSVGAPWDDYTSQDDVTMKWWKADEQSTDEIGLPGNGTFVMVNGGKRYLPGKYPTGEPAFFDPKNTSHHLTYDQLPPGDRWTRYQHDASHHTNYCGKTVDECYPESATG